MCGKCSLFPPLVQQRVVKKIPFPLSTFEKENGAHGTLSEISAKLFFCTADKRKGEIDYLNNSLTSDLSSFERVFSVIAAYFTLRKHHNFSPGSLELPKPFDESFSPSDVVVKCLCAWAFILV